MEGKELLKALEERLDADYSVEGYEDDVPEGWKEYPLCWLAYGERDSCIREGSPFWNDDVLQGIISLLYDYHRSLAFELESWIPLDSQHSLLVYVEPSYEDRSTVLVIEPKTSKVVLLFSVKVWNFQFATPDILAEELEVTFHLMMSALIKDRWIGRKKARTLPARSVMAGKNPLLEEGVDIKEHSVKGGEDV